LNFCCDVIKTLQSVLPAKTLRDRWMQRKWM